MQPISKNHYKVDPLAQSVEHNTFNVGVLGSSPKRITKNNPQETDYQSLADLILWLVRIAREVGYDRLPGRLRMTTSLRVVEISELCRCVVVEDGGFGIYFLVVVHHGRVIRLRMLLLE